MYIKKELLHFRFSVCDVDCWWNKWSCITSLRKQNIISNNDMQIVIGACDTISCKDNLHVRQLPEQNFEGFGIVKVGIPNSEVFFVATVWNIRLTTDSAVFVLRVIQFMQKKTTTVKFNTGSIIIVWASSIEWKTCTFFNT